MSDPNQAQAEFWSTEGGRKWVQFQGVMDTTLAPALDLLMAGAALRPGQSVLDIGCGAGASSRAAAAIVGPGARVTGADISATLLEEAERHAADQPSTGFICVDAQTHVFAPEYDALISRFGVMFFDDPVAAFPNMARALRPGGQVTFVCWAGVDLNPWFRLPAQIAARHLGPSEPPAPHAPGPMAFADEVYTQGLLKEAGLSDVCITPSSVMLTPPGDPAQVASLATRIGPAASRIAAVEADTLAMAENEADIAEAFALFETPQGMRIPAVLHLCQARVA